MNALIYIHLCTHIRIHVYNNTGNLQDTVERMKTESESSREESQRLHTIQIGKCLLLIIMIEE
jgi:hypothetical protein